MNQKAGRRPIVFVKFGGIRPVGIPVVWEGKEGRKG
jgi:hypothetical protein